MDQWIFLSLLSPNPHILGYPSIEVPTLSIYVHYSQGRIFQFRWIQFGNKLGKEKQPSTLIHFHQCSSVEFSTSEILLNYLLEIIWLFLLWNVTRNVCFFAANSILDPDTRFSFFSFAWTTFTSPLKHIDTSCLMLI